MIILPFADDIRHLKFGAEEEEGEKNKAIVATHDQIDKAKALISKLILPGSFSPDSFDNPVLQRHYANLQALALDQEPDGSFDNDTTMPDYERIKIKAENEIKEFKESIGIKDAGEIAEPAPSNSKKRSAADYDCIKEIEAIKNDPKALAKFTVSDLKSYLDSIGIKAKRLKSEIIDQFTQHFNWPNWKDWAPDNQITQPKW